MNLIELISSNLTLYFWIISGILLLLFIIQLLYYILVYKKPYSYEIRRNKDKEKDIDLPSVSVIVVSKNESENIKKNLPSILEQDYPNFDVIVVNMGSTDETDIELKALELKYPNLYHTFVPADAESVNEKKLALTIGIKASNSDVLLFTEAYCKPVSDKWIEEFAYEFAKGNDIVLGYSKLKIDNKFSMRSFIHYDNLIHQTKLISMAIWGKPFMGIGRNLSYKRSVFFEENGFSSVLSYEEGEDDIFINRISKKRKVGVAVSPDSLIETNIVNRFGTWRQLKSKYIYGKKYYKGSSSFFFWFEAFTKYLFYILSAFSVVYGVLISNYAIIVVATLLFIARFFIALYVMNKIGKMLEDCKVHVNIIILELFQPFNNYKFRKRIKKRRQNR